MNIKMVYVIKEQTMSNKTTHLVEIDKTHDLFNGHFPGSPILPGVIMLQILKDLVEKSLNLTLQLTHYNQVKFLSIVDPNFQNALIYNFEILEKDQKFLVKNQTTLIDDSIVLKCNATFVKH